jgi:hypothetical protein
VDNNNFTIVLKKFIFTISECENIKRVIKNKRPKTSDGSQSHQPPHVPSCNAQYDPKNKAIVLINNELNTYNLEFNNKMFI